MHGHRHSHLIHGLVRPILLWHTRVLRSHLLVWHWPKLGTHVRVRMQRLDHVMNDIGSFSRIHAYLLNNRIRHVRILRLYLED